MFNRSTPLAACLIAGLSVAAAQADDLGQETYTQYCATCHGMTGAGDGPLTEIMLEKPSDLRTLTARNDGVFPMLEVMHIVDGRTGLRAHGGPMPVYGAVFQAEAEAANTGFYGSELAVRGRILSVLYYLESIQQE